MNFQSLAKIENYQTYLDIAFKNGKKETEKVRREAKNPNKLLKSRIVELARINTIAKSLSSLLEHINKSFPSIDYLDPFYLELIKCTLEYDKLKQSLGAIKWAKTQVKELTHKYKSDIRRTRHPDKVNVLRSAYLGRVSSVIKQINKNLAYLESCRKIMKGYPAIKTGAETVVLAGAPNVGKSTLLAALTGSKPKVAHYPFTTQTINIGYDKEKIQYVDTPGILDRPLSKRNSIERQSIIALKHVAKVVVFVIDPSEACGYTVAEQKKLLLEIKKAFKLPIITVSNKADTGEKFPKALAISAKERKGVDELKKEIKKELSK